MTDYIRAWHFVGKTLRDGRPIPRNGQWLVHPGKAIICESGLHASRRPSHALEYAPGPVLCLVECDGIVDEQHDKLVCKRRRIIECADITTTLRYFRPQIAALRAADDTHLVTISNHMRSWNLWEGAARHFLGYTPAEQYPYVDFFTYHANYDINDFANDRPEMEAPYEVAVQARLACAAGVKPVIIEEYTFAT